MLMLRDLAQKIHFHPVLILFGAIALVTGSLMQIVIIFVIIFWHEMGHYIAARFYKWRITEIMFWVFGGVMKTDEQENHPISEDVIVTISGPLQHLFIYLLLVVCTYFNLLPASILSIAYHYNLLILSFNLLPLYPLDGGKLLFYLLSVIFPYRRAHGMIIRFSLIAALCLIVFQLVFLPFTLSALLLMGFIFFENRTEWKNRYYHFIRFLLGRKRNGLTEKPVKQLFVHEQAKLFDVFSLFYRDKYHEVYLWQSNEIMFTERDCLARYFNDYKYSESLHEWAKSVKLRKREKK